jgi:2-phosphoglycerate kinase
MNDQYDEPKIDLDKFITVEGSGYDYTFSRGMLAHSLELRGLPLDEAYRVAKKVQTLLKSKGITRINENELREYVKTMAVHFFGEEIATHYNLFEEWQHSSVPIIILISGARGTGTSQVGEIIASRLAIPSIVSTNIVATILKKMISKELAPELHSKSYLAHENLRPIYSVLYDKILIGFEEHSRFVAEAIEALVSRALIEGLSMVIRGEHLVPRFLSSELIDHPNVIYVTLRMKDEDAHLKRYQGYYDTEVKERRTGYFPAIRKIHEYLVEEAKNRENIILRSDDLQEVVDKINDITIERLESMFSSAIERTTQIKFKLSDIHS